MTNTPVQAVVHGAGEALPASMAGRFGAATTWGEAVVARIAGQNAAYRAVNPLGSWFYWSDAMSLIELLRAEDVDVALEYPDGLQRVAQQGLADLTPWHLMDREAAKQRLQGLRGRYKAKYVPFARRQGNDDIACIDPDRPGHVILVHDFAGEGYERRREFDSFWDWFRAAVEDMILFE